MSRICEACGAQGAHKTEDWYLIGDVWLCKRCDRESTSFTTEFEIWVHWSDAKTSYVIKRTRRFGWFEPRV